MNESASMPRRAGLTLIEVLAATVLLGVLAVTCVPLLRDIAVTGTQPPVNIDHIDLSFAADAIIENRSSLGLDTWPAEPTLIPWPDDPSHPLVEVRLQARPSVTDGGWLIFRCEAAAVVRWVALDPEQSTSAGDGP
jgi:prepilin-type N-terminal cleavage/methylation domain-containing protein